MFRRLVILVLSTTCIFSCATKKEILYFQDIEEYQQNSFETTDTNIQIDDILQVNISAYPPEIAIPYNRIKEVNSSNQQNIIDGYLVSANGYITIPVLGKVYAIEKSAKELEESIRARLISENHIVDNPIVEVKVFNKKFTVLGEVGSPGIYNFFENGFNILQALGSAGDLTINGKRENIMIIRRFDGETQVSRIDLTSAELLKSPFFYIKPNDFIYVEPNGPKVKSAGYIGNLGTLIGVFSIILSTTLLLTR